MDYELNFIGLKERRLPKFIKKNLYPNDVIKFLNYASSLVNEGETILDCGCGDKRLKVAFPQAKYISFDKCISRDHFNYSDIDIVGDAEELTKYVDKVNHIISFGVVEHLEYPDKVLKQFNKVLNKGGNLFMTIPFLSKIHLEPDDYHRYTKYGVIRLLEKHKFRVVKIGGYGGICILITTRLRDLFMKFPKFFNYMCTLFIWIPLQIIAVQLDNLEDKKNHALCYYVHGVK